MRSKWIWIAVVLALAAASAVAWIFAWPHAGTTRVESTANTGRIIYYQDPSGAPVYSPTPRKDAKGRDFVAVRAPAEKQDDAKRDGKRVKYYRNPMGLADTSPVPKKDSMGMDYIPVYAEESAEPGTVKVSLDKMQRLGVSTAVVTRQVLNETVTLPAAVAADERRQSVVSLKFKTWISKLHVAATGERVRKGQPLFDIQSPFLLQQETTLALALRNRDASRVMGDVYARTNATSESSARDRLHLYDVPEQEIARLIRTLKPSGQFTWYAPQDGTVLEKPVIAGMYAEEGTLLYRLADLSRVWVISEVPESALHIVSVGAAATISLRAYPGRSFEGRLSFVYPEVAMTTRTVKARVELDNREGLLLPGMFASMDVAARAGAPVNTVPESALIDNGTRQVVLVARGEGLFAPQSVTAGRHSGGNVEILEGLKEGDRVVTSATFLIDAESNLQSALQAFDKKAPQ